LLWAEHLGGPRAPAGLGVDPLQESADRHELLPEGAARPATGMTSPCQDIWDRLGRSLRHLIDVVHDLEQRGVALVSLTEQIDTSTPGGRLIFHVFASLAQFEKELIRNAPWLGWPLPGPAVGSVDDRRCGPRTS